MRIHWLAACAALFITIPTLARAQGAGSVVSLADPDPPGWDVFGHVAWLTVDKSDIAPEWNEWYDVATFGGSVAKYITPNLRLEFDAATSAEAEIYVDHSVRPPGQAVPVFISQTNRFRMTTASAGASYQFFNNRYFHPVVGAGVESVRETRAADSVAYPFVPPSVVVPATGPDVTWRVHPFVSAGFKGYLSERAFVRSDVRTSFDAGGVSHVSWRTGIGVDF